MAEKTENRVKIGAKVNESVYAEFKQHVFDATGQKRGVLGEAVEAALRQYMEDTKDGVDGDVSNADLLREIRALRSSDATPAPPPEGEKNDLTVPEEKPPVNAATGDRVAWLASEVNIQGRVPFDTLVKEVGRHYPQHSDSKCRELAWRWAAVRAPTPSDYPDEAEYSGEMRLDKPVRDFRLRKRAEAENKPSLLTGPRRHENGAWFSIVEAYSDAALNHQEPTERGEVEVYLGEGGARKFAEEFGLLDSDEESESEAKWPTDSVPSDGSDGADESDEPGESSDDGGSDEISAEDFDDVGIDGATDWSGEAEEEADDLLDELEGADRGR
jgi:hypothetical protein